MARHKKRIRLSFILLGAFLALLLFFVLQQSYELNHVHVEEEIIRIGNMEKVLDGFTILHISDLHGKNFGDNQSGLIQAIQSMKFHAVAVTGNMVGKNGDLTAVNQLAFALQQRNVPVVFITGENDPPALNDQPGETVYSSYIREMQRYNWIYLDAPHTITVGARQVHFYPEHQINLDVQNARSNLLGQRQRTSDTVALREIAHGLSVLDRLEETRAAFQTGDINVALMRYPLARETMLTMNPSQSKGEGETTAEDIERQRKANSKHLHLALAGHYNGGQARFPFGLGAIYIPAPHLSTGGWFPDQSLVSGLIRAGGIAQYTSPGLGVSPKYPFPMRLFNPPTITLLRLTNEVAATE